MQRLNYIFVLLCFSVLASAQVQVYPLSEHIRTLRVLRECDLDESGQLRTARPFLVLNDGRIDGTDPENTLEISFDEMSHDVHQYSYSVTHMSADWSLPSSISSVEYLQGFSTQDITDYQHSINTTREYTHYRFSFPNEEMVVTYSGNYLLSIYEDGNPDKRVAEVRFCVVEPMTTITADVRANTDIEFNGRYQQLDFDVSTTAINLKDPNEIKIAVRQNNRTDNQVWVTRPTFVEPRRLRYQNLKQLIFEGGNEYHHFDAFSTYYSGTGIDRMFYEMGDYHALLFLNQPASGTYIHEYDNDGKYRVNAERTFDSDIESEYVWVHWTLSVDKPWLDGAVYVGGDIFSNELKLSNRMQYDAEAGCYWLTALVKQGGYDYQYWFKGKGTQNQTTTQRTDGSYWQTENEYSIYVYWRPFGARYDRLVGLLIQKSTL